MAKPLASTFALNRYLGTEYLPRAVGTMELWQAAWLPSRFSGPVRAAEHGPRVFKSNVSLRRLANLRYDVRTDCHNKQQTTQQEQ
jgi:hypothetical protein